MLTPLDDLVDTIPHASLRKLTARALQEAPSSFWSAPASTSGKYHPADSLGIGGLLRHTRKVYHLTAALMAMEGTSRESIVYSVCLAAALLHDTHKVTLDSPHSHFDHPLRAARAVRTLLPEYPDIPHEAGEMLLHSISAHMGRWTTSKHEPDIVLPLPKSFAAKLVHTADFLASRNFITLEPESV